MLLSKSLYLAWKELKAEFGEKLTEERSTEDKEESRESKQLRTETFNNVMSPSNEGAKLSRIPLLLTHLTSAQKSLVFQNRKAEAIF